MNLRQPNANDVTGSVNRSRSVVPMSGLCTSCHDGCTGGCEVFLATMRGRELLYPQNFGEVTAGADKDYPVDYSHLNIQGYAVGADGLPDGVEPGPDTALFPRVDTETEYGWDKKVKMKMPVFTGALGSTEIARRNWEHFAVGAAISGITLVCGENVCGIDPLLELKANGKVALAPEMDRRIETYKRYHTGFGEILVQMNVEDTRLGVAEYVLDKHGLETIELKWGQGAKCIGGEIKVKTLDRALELARRGYIVLPDPTHPGRPGLVPRRRDPRVRAPLAPRLRHPRRLPGRSRAAPQARLRAHHAQDRRLLARSNWRWRSATAPRPRSTC